VELSRRFFETGILDQTTPFIQAVQESDLVIDFSGDIWGDNADFLGENRFLVGLLKDLTAINLRKPVAMLAGSPGPFSNHRTAELAKEVYGRFSLVTNREPLSTELLRQAGFDTRRTHTLACPSFLFQAAPQETMAPLLAREGLSRPGRTKPIVGFVLCGWNFPNGPFDRWPREDTDYTHFATAVEHICNSLGAQVCLLSHSNGFDPAAGEFQLKHGRDYPIIKQLQSVVRSRGLAEDVFALDGVYDAWQTKAIIGSFDMLVSGRVHAAAAAFSQRIPTVVIDYGHEPKAHKLSGFAKTVGAEGYVADPTDAADLIARIDDCWQDRARYRAALEARLPGVEEMARCNFSLLAGLI